MLSLVQDEWVSKGIGEVGISTGGGLFVRSSSYRIKVLSFLEVSVQAVLIQHPYGMQSFHSLAVAELSNLGPRREERSPGRDYGYLVHPILWPHWPVGFMALDQILHTTVLRGFQRLRNASVIISVFLISRDFEDMLL